MCTRVQAKLATEGETTEIAVLTELDESGKTLQRAFGQVSGMQRSEGKATQTLTQQKRTKTIGRTTTRQKPDTLLAVLKTRVYTEPNRLGSCLTSALCMARS